MAVSHPQTAEAFAIMADKIQDAEQVLKAMSSETRLKILCALSGGELSVNKLAELTSQSPSAVSQHLSKLKAANLVTSRRDAQTIYYDCVPGIGLALINTLCSFYAPQE